MDLVTLSVLAALGLAIVAAFVWWRGVAARLSRQITESSLTLDEVRDQLNQLERDVQNQQSQLEEIRAGSIGMGQRLKELANTLSGQAATVEQLKNQDPETRLYGKAAKLVDAGATVEELMQECELPRAEAELLISLKKRPQ